MIFVWEDDVPCSFDSSRYSVQPGTSLHISTRQFRIVVVMLIYKVEFTLAFCML